MRANTALSEIWFGILGKRAEAAGPSLDLIRRVNETFDVRNLS